MEPTLQPPAPLPDSPLPPPESTSKPTKINKRIVVIGAVLGVILIGGSLLAFQALRTGANNNPEIPTQQTEALSPQPVDTSEVSEETPAPAANEQDATSPAASTPP